MHILNMPIVKLMINDILSDTDTNPIFRAACLHYLAPIELAARLGRLSEGRSEDVLISCYARGGVITGSPSEPLASFKDVDWESWLMTNRAEFRTIKSVAEHKANFDPNAEGDDHADGEGSAKA